MRHCAIFRIRPCTACCNGTCAGREWRGNMSRLLPEARRGHVEALFSQWGGIDWTALRHSVIHGDANDYNVIVGAGRMVGLLDFGDMVYSATVCDLAIALAYTMLGEAEPLRVAAQVIRAYQDRCPLNEAEQQALFPLVLSRLAMSVCYSAHNRARNPDDPYQVVSEAGGLGFAGQARGLLEPGDGAHLGLIVRRTLVFRRPGDVVGWRAAQPLRYGLELRVERLNFPVLPEHHIAQFGGGPLQEGDLGLDLLQGLVVHGWIVRSRRSRRPRRRPPYCARLCCRHERQRQRCHQGRQNNRQGTHAGTRAEIDSRDVYCIDFLRRRIAGSRRRLAADLA